MKSYFLPDAEEEFLESSRYYESEAPGVGVAFIVEVHRAVSAMSPYPAQLRKYEGASAKNYSTTSHTTYFILLRRI